VCERRFSYLILSSLRSPAERWILFLLSTVHLPLVVLSRAAILLERSREQKRTAWPVLRSSALGVRSPCSSICRAGRDPFFLCVDSAGQGHVSRLPLSDFFSHRERGVVCSVFRPGSGVHPGVGSPARFPSCAVRSLRW
jgi:hypothetical protein